MNEAAWALALIAAAGLVGGFLIVRLTSGLGTVFGCLLWLLLPVAVIAFLLAAKSDMTLAPAQRSYNFSFGLVLVSLIVTVPWAIANALGGVIGLLFRKPNSAGAAAPLDTFDSGPKRDTGLPDWSRADNPSLSLAELGELIAGAADLAGIDRECLPHVGPLAGGEGLFIDRDKFDYIYVGYERGQPMFDHRTVIADQLVYWVLRDAAFALAANRLAERRVRGERIDDADYADLLAAEQAQILGDVDPGWERQFVAERAARLAGEA